MERFLSFPKKFENKELSDKWDQLLRIRDICNLSIEEKRGTKEIGSSLEAALTIELDKKSLEQAKGIDLSELCITSSAEIKDGIYDKISVETKKAKGFKCPVCWKINELPCPRHDTKNV